MIKCAAIVVTFFGVFATAAVPLNEKVSVEVYYESLCPDSYKFITQQLHPVLNTDLGQYVNLTLYPAGKSWVAKDEMEGFTCHHGPEECVGNKIHACARNKLSQNSDGLDFNKEFLGLVNCFMGAVLVKPRVLSVQKCSEDNSVKIADEIKACAEGEEGVKALAEMVDITKSLKPALSNVPTIVFNHEYKKEDSQLAEKDLGNAICQHITGTKPKECT